MVLASARTRLGVVGERRCAHGAVIGERCRVLGVVTVNGLAWCANHVPPSYVRSEGRR